ncbi:MAG: hypothetical protein RLZZ214_1057 [Verrucomicrobiota bacterium]
MIVPRRERDRSSLVAIFQFNGDGVGHALRRLEMPVFTNARHSFNFKFSGTKTKFDHFLSLGKETSFERNVQPLPLSHEPRHHHP